ncbi:MAG: hypothetical protein RR554_03850 [Vagococcus sp.]|uniref:hypothetical protein n=1 Tax=Vagococcus sp. TaxID=1933889 RepID=UPI002FC58D02
MINHLISISVTPLALSSVIITRPDITGLIKPMHLLLVIAIIQYVVGLIAFKVYLNKESRKKKKIIPILSMISGIIAETVFFLSGATNVTLLFILATMKGSAKPTDYLIFIGLIYFFSALASLGVLSLMKTGFLKKRGKKKKRQSVTFNNYIVSVSLVSGITYLLVYLLFPTSFSILAISYILSFFVVTFVGLMLQKVKYTKNKKQKKRHKSKSKKRNNQKKSLNKKKHHKKQSSRKKK